MTPTDVSKILERLSVIETKVDVINNGVSEDRKDRKSESLRVRRLELVVFSMLATWGADVAGLPTPFS